MHVTQLQVSTVNMDKLLTSLIAVDLSSRRKPGVVEAMGPQVQVTSGDVSVIYQGDVILGRLAMGADFLNPAACVELFAGTTTKPAAFGATYPANA